MRRAAYYLMYRKLHVPDASTALMQRFLRLAGNRDLRFMTYAEETIDKDFADGNRWIAALTDKIDLRFSIIWLWRGRSVSNRCGPIAEIDILPVIWYLTFYRVIYENNRGRRYNLKPASGPVSNLIEAVHQDGFFC